ncbi:hypothetical protein [Paenibacillus xylaniclasticus]|uniref:hypothetical protein n=1 Tax=Paenibacillus xylaniclasticus TaxID=588083 RepID=UPI000FD96CFD|nr:MULTISPECIES: hypothetical protein [Paenibacillus]GFN30857.1 hypothetical protein PCURB6_11170 [Paenibacillus curdlanolyticus]
MAHISYNGGKQDCVEIEHEQFGIELWTPSMMAELAGTVFPIDERVPGAVGYAFDWATWFDEWLHLITHTSQCTLAPATHLKLYAADSFEAVIPWPQLKDAAVLYANEEELPLEAAGPIRFYVPNGTSKCLNVKNVVRIVVCVNDDSVTEAAYGFKSQFSPDDLLLKKRSTS